MNRKIALFMLLCLVSPVVHAQKPTPAATKPSIPPITNQIILPPTPSAPPIPWYRDFPWTLVAAVVAGGFGITYVILQRNGTERTRKSNEAIAEAARLQTLQTFQEGEAAREKQSNENIAAARKQFDEKQDADRTSQETLRKQFVEKQEQDARFATEKTLHDQFVDIQNRFEKENDSVRASASLRLGDFAKTPKANQPSLDLDKDNYPYFIPIARQLATALTLEPRAEIRKAIGDALTDMTTFAKNGDEGDQNLLYALIHLLADANRTAKDNFIEAMADYTIAWPMKLAVETKKPQAEAVFVASVARFSENNNASLCSLADLIKTGLLFEGDKTIRESDYHIRQEVSKRIYDSLELSEKSEHRKKMLDSFDIASRQLIDTKRSLSFSLNWRNLRATSDYVKTADKMRGNESTRQLERWKCSDKFSLRDCFLVGVDLTNVQLPRIDISGASMHGSNLTAANLWRAHMLRTKLSYSQLEVANLDEALMAGASLENASCIQTQFQETNMLGVCLQGTNFFMASLQGADLSESVCNSHTSFHLIQVRDVAGVDEHPKTNFGGVNWWEASIIDNSTDVNETNKVFLPFRLGSWLQENYPRPTEVAPKVPTVSSENAYDCHVDILRGKLETV